MKRFWICLVCAVLVSLSCRLARGEFLSPPSPEIISYTSKLDGALQQAYFATNDWSDQPKPLIMHLCPPNFSTDDEAFAYARRALRAVGEPAVYVRPFGRGGTVFQDTGEIDFFEALAAVQKKTNIDPTRISLFGTSMGGAGALYLASHYPDRFSAVATVAGYSDYQLWNKPGYIFQRSPWEEYSWRSRSATYLVENLRDSALWFLHGEWDRNSTVGGVDVEQSLQLVERLKKSKIPYQMSILPNVGHEITTLINPFSPGRKFDADIFSWLVKSRLTVNLRNLELKTFSLRHNRNAWLRINQFSEYGNLEKPAHVAAVLEPHQSLKLTTANVEHLTVGPIPDEANLSLRIDGDRLSDINAKVETHFEKSRRDKWTIVSTLPLKTEKRFGNAGPIGDIFFEPTLFVSGTTGNPEEDYFNRSVPSDIIRFMQFNNGGVNRGEMLGSRNLLLLQKKDKEISSSDKREFNLALFGNDKTNALIAQYQHQIPLRFGAHEIMLSGKVYKGDDVAVIAIFPNPDNDQRYLLIHGGVSPDAQTWGSNLNLALLPDYIVYNREKVLAWGFFNNAWRL